MASLTRLHVEQVMCEKEGSVNEEVDRQCSSPASRLIPYAPCPDWVSVCLLKYYVSHAHIPEGIGGAGVPDYQPYGVCLSEGLQPTHLSLLSYP